MTDRCESKTSEKYGEIQRQQRDNPDYDGRCIRQAKYKIDGRLLCATHAGEAALDKMKKMGTAKRWVSVRI